MDHHQFAFPSSRLLSATEKFTCPQCGRDAFQIFHCPDRKHDACPFVKGWGGRTAGIWGTLFGLAFLGLWSASMFRTAWLLWLIWGAPLGGFLVWLALIYRQLYHRNSGTVLERISVLGLAVRLRIMTKLPIVLLPFRPAALPRYPLSVVALGWQSSILGAEEDRAACVFRAALVELLARDLIDIQPLTISIAGRNGTAQAKSTDYCVIERPSGIAALQLGQLEASILRTVADSSRTQTGRDGWLDGPRVYELVRAYFATNRSNPYRVLLESVERNGAELGVCTVENPGFFGMQRKVAWGGPRFEAMQADHRLLQDFEGQFMHAYPELWSGLFSQIAKGIKSRIDNSD